MGGLLIVLVVLGIFFFLRQPDAATFAPLAALAGVGALGAFDDYLNARTGEGIRARQKLIWLTVVAFVAAWQIQQTYAIDEIAVPFVGAVAIEPWLYVLFAAFAIVAASNGVNLTDGLDGLSGGTVAIAFVAYMLIALLNVPNQANLALLCALIIGALLGFLWFNVHPAQIFIGDSGALSLGATLAVTALITGQILVLPLIGIIFVVETLSVIIQIGYFRLTGGKRVFRMAPLHHHFELGGWDEEKITIRFWIIGILAALLGVTLFWRRWGCVTTMTTVRPSTRRADDGRDRRCPARQPSRSWVGTSGEDWPGSSPTGRVSRSTTAAPDELTRISPRADGRLDSDPMSSGHHLGRARWSRSPSINPDYPTEPAAGRPQPWPPTRTHPASPNRTVPPPVPCADDRRHRHEGQDDDGVADRRDPRFGRRPPGSPGRQHRDPARRAAAGAHAEPPRRHRAL
jgi:phospho-N-acetylmuramoyl-pentapeptide-transferase